MQVIGDGCDVVKRLDIKANRDVAYWIDYNIVIKQLVMPAKRLLR